MTQIAGPQFNCHSDYDCIINAVFPDVQCFVRMKQDPYYKAKVMPDHENFADTQRSRYGPTARPIAQAPSADPYRMSVGWIEDHVLDGKAIYPNHNM